MYFENNSFHDLKNLKNCNLEMKIQKSLWLLRTYMIKVKCLQTARYPQTNGPFEGPCWHEKSVNEQRSFSWLDKEGYDQGYKFSTLTMIQWSLLLFEPLEFTEISLLSSSLRASRDVGCIQIVLQRVWNISVRKTVGGSEIMASKFDGILSG